ncbi:hypothetical protein C8P63_1255 [Melghirimyces profundicolus]|uniref:Uncharacterized protein n=2 Tax=Melghirimyces profundicolus TaxID=1242148 RepID=A0A2T6BCT5_9BACL|nr:hypothetical protein C8P63_1255 [Melghirimyces profundicolus]
MRNRETLPYHLADFSFFISDKGLFTAVFPVLVRNFVTVGFSPGVSPESLFGLPSAENFVHVTPPLWPQRLNPIQEKV